MNEIQQAQETEQRCLAKFENKARDLQAQNSRLTWAHAYGLAVEQLPKTYQRYCDARDTLRLRGKRPLLKAGER
jgi:hypothetical protein